MLTLDSPETTPTNRPIAIESDHGTSLTNDSHEDLTQDFGDVWAALSAEEVAAVPELKSTEAPEAATAPDNAPSETDAPLEETRGELFAHNRTLPLPPTPDLPNTETRGNSTVVEETSDPQKSDPKQQILTDTSIDRPHAQFQTPAAATEVMTADGTVIVGGSSAKIESILPENGKIPIEHLTSQLTLLDTKKGLASSEVAPPLHTLDTGAARVERTAANPDQQPTPVPTPNSPTGIINRISGPQDNVALRIAANEPARSHVQSAAKGDAPTQMTPVLNAQGPKVSLDSPQTKREGRVRDVALPNTAPPSGPQRQMDVNAAPVAPALPIAEATKLDSATLPVLEPELSPLQTTTASNIQPRSAAPVPSSYAPQVTAQVATAVAQMSSGTTQIILNPQELGRVRLTLTTTEHGIAVAVSAERPETIDLMRRHVDLLVQEFEDLERGGIDFHFNDNRPNPGDSESNNSNKATLTGEISDPITTPATIPTAASSGGLDLKL